MSKPGRVCFAFVHNGHYSESFAESSIDLLMFDLYGAQRIIPDGHRMRKLCSTGDLEGARNDLTRAFLDGECEWLLFIDADMGFGGDTLERLIKAADKYKRPVMGALCFGQRARARGENYVTRHRIVPTIYDFVDGDKPGFLPRMDYPRDQVTEVAATGAACLLIHRRVIQGIATKYGDVWWNKITHQAGTTFSEDLSFCIRAADLGQPVCVHTGIKTSHDKGGLFLDEEAFDRQQAAEKEAPVEVTV